MHVLFLLHPRIWVQNMSERGWKEEDSRLTSVAVRRTHFNLRKIPSAPAYFWELECGRRILKSRGKKGFGNAREATGSSPSHSVKLSCEVLDTLHKLPGNIWQLQFAGCWFIFPCFTACLALEAAIGLQL